MKLRGESRREGEESPGFSLYPEKRAYRATGEGAHRVPVGPDDAHSGINRLVDYGELPSVGMTLANIESWLLAAVFSAGMIAAWWAGWRLGCRLRLNSGRSQIVRFHDASLALLGLLLAFTFSMSLGKHDQRRLTAVSDSNAIGDFYTCATLLNEPFRSRLQAAIRRNTELHIGLSGRWLEKSSVEKTLEKIQDLETEMTVLVTEAVHSGTPIPQPLTNTLNEVTSMNAARIAAIEDRLPPPIILLLFVTAVLTMVLVGREQGAQGEIQVAGTLGFILLVTLVIDVILDLNQPARGFITVSQEPLLRLLWSMGK